MEETIAQVEGWFSILSNKHAEALKQGMAKGEIMEPLTLVLRHDRSTTFYGDFIPTWESKVLRTLPSSWRYVS